MKRVCRRQVAIALTLFVAFACQETWALAATTGGLSGTVLDADTAAPIAGAQVTAVSPSRPRPSRLTQGGVLYSWTWDPTRIR